MSEFEGGGFFPTSGRASYEGQGWQPSDPKAQVANTLRSITIAQLQRAVACEGLTGDTIKIDDVEAMHFVLCGQIMSSSNTASSHLYTINDGTGNLVVKSYTPKSDDLAEAKKDEEQLTEGTWCMIYGHYKYVDKEYFINALRIRCITNYNEINFHFATCIRQHLHFTRGPLPDTIPESKVETNTVTTGMSMEHPVSQTIHYNQLPPPGINKSDIYARIADVFQRSRSGDVHFDEICHVLGNDFSRNVIQSALNTMAADGRVHPSNSPNRFIWSG